jgi:hypothetical protein
MSEGSLTTPLTTAGIHLSPPGSTQCSYTIVIQPEPTEVEIVAASRVAFVAAEYEAEQEATEQRRPRALSRPMLRRLRHHGYPVAPADAQYCATVLQFLAVRFADLDGARQRDVFLRRVVIRDPDSGARAVAMRLLDMDDRELRFVLQLVVQLLSESQAPCQSVPRRDTGPPLSRHVATPIVANAPPARLPIATEYAERRAA